MRFSSINGTANEHFYFESIRPQVTIKSNVSVLIEERLDVRSIDPKELFFRLGIPYSL